MRLEPIAHLLLAHMRSTQPCLFVIELQEAASLAAHAQGEVGGGEGSGAAVRLGQQGHQLLELTICTCRVLSSVSVRPNMNEMRNTLRAYREKRAAAKAQGRQHDSDSENISEPEVSDGEEGGNGGDPFFQHDNDPFNDPFFKVCNESGNQSDLLPGPSPSVGRLCLHVIQCVAASGPLESHLQHASWDHVESTWCCTGSCRPPARAAFRRSCGSASGNCANLSTWSMLSVPQDDGAQPQPEAGPKAAKAKKSAKAARAAEKAAAAAEKEAEARRVAELQLLMMDDDALRRPNAAPAAAGRRTVCRVFDDAAPGHVLLVAAG